LIRKNAEKKRGEPECFQRREGTGPIGSFDGGEKKRTPWEEESCKEKKKKQRDYKRKKWRHEKSTPDISALTEKRGEKELRHR